MNPLRLAAMALVIHCAGAGAGELGFPGLGEPLPGGTTGRSAACLPSAVPAEIRCALAGPAFVADIPVTEMSADVRDAVVVSATAFFQETDFEALVRALSSRWGPGEARDEELRAGMGATFTNAIRIWRRDHEVWLAEQYAGRITRSALVRMSPAALDAMLEKRKAETENGSRAL